MHNQRKLQEVHRRADAQQADWPTRLVTVHHGDQNARAEAKPHAQHVHGQEPAAGAAAAAAARRAHHAISRSPSAGAPDSHARSDGSELY